MRQLWLLGVCDISGADERIFMKFGSGVVLKFLDNRTNSERTLYSKTAHVSVCIFFVNMCKHYW